MRKRRRGKNAQPHIMMAKWGYYLTHDTRCVIRSGPMTLFLFHLCLQLSKSWPHYSIERKNYANSVFNENAMKFHNWRQNIHFHTAKINHKANCVPFRNCIALIILFLLAHTQNKKPKKEELNCSQLKYTFAGFWFLMLLLLSAVAVTGSSVFRIFFS